MGAPASAPRPPAWLGSLVDAAPDVVAVWMAMGGDFAGLLAARREMRRRITVGSAQAVLAQQHAIADALAATLRDLPAAALRAPGGEEEWNVAQAFAHTTAARRFLPAWAAMAAADEWPVDRPPVVTPSVPGPPDASVEDLLILLAKSRRSQERSASLIAGHETRRCPLDHPLVGHLRCGDWLLFAGVHDLMHLEQLHRIGVSGHGARPVPGSPAA